jgi:hypothetical protein
MQILIDIIYYYEWKTQGENCPACDAMDGQLFEEGYEPGSHPNCDCYMVPAGYELIYEEVADMEPGFWRNYLFTGIDGMKVISSDGLGPKLEDIFPNEPSPSSYSRDQLDLFL